MAEAGERFEAYIRDAMTEARIPTVLELVRQTGINRGTWYTWWRGEVARPSRSTLNQAVPVLGRSVDQMLAAWDGRDAPARQLTNEQLEKMVERIVRRVLAGRRTE